MGTERTANDQVGVGEGLCDQPGAGNGSNGALPLHLKSQAGALVEAQLGLHRHSHCVLVQLVELRIKNWAAHRRPAA